MKKGVKNFMYLMGILMLMGCIVWIILLSVFLDNNTVDFASYCIQGNICLVTMLISGNLIKRGA